MKLQFVEQKTSELLADFCCGIKEMDEFIHESLDTAIQQHPCRLFVVKNDYGNVVAMFVICEGHLIDCNDIFEDKPCYGEPFAVLDDRGRLATRVRYSTLEIEYLAVKEDLRNMHIGKVIIQNLVDLARRQKSDFITVDAYFNETYSAVPFYEKVGFIPVESIREGSDTLRMVLYVE